MRQSHLLVGGGAKTACSGSRKRLQNLARRKYVDWRAGLSSFSPEFACSDDTDLGLETNETAQLGKRQQGAGLHANSGSVWRAITPLLISVRKRPFDGQAKPLAVAVR